MLRCLFLSGSCLLLVVCLGADCQGSLPAGSLTPVVGDSSGICVVDDGVGFKVSLPCDAVRNQSQDLTEGLSYEETFTGADGALYSLEVVLPETIAGGGVGGASVGAQGNLRFEGVMTTYSGDYVVLQTIRFDFGDFFRALTVLKDGSLLRAGVMASSQSRDQQLLTLLSIDVSDGDGSGILTWQQGSLPELSAPCPDGYVLLNDSSVWYVSSSNRLSVAKWGEGDAVFGLAADRFYVDAFLTRLPDWNSVPSDFVGVAEFLQVVSIDPLYSCTDVTLSDGSVWTACTDASVLDGLAIGETVAIFEDYSHYIMDLSTGVTALVIP